MNVFISGPIKGHENYKDRFSEAAKQISNTIFNGKFIRVINPALLSEMYPDRSEEFYQEKCFRMIREEANAIYLLKGWEESHGASMECGYARGLDKEIYFEEKPIQAF